MTFCENKTNRIDSFPFFSFSFRRRVVVGITGMITPEFLTWFLVAGTFIEIRALIGAGIFRGFSLGV